MNGTDATTPIGAGEGKAGSWYRTTRGDRVLVVGPGSAAGVFELEMASGRKTEVDAAFPLFPDTKDTEEGATTDALYGLAEIVKAKNRDGLASALEVLETADLDRVLSRFPQLWIIQAVTAERKSRDGVEVQKAEPRSEPDKAIVCPVCAQPCAARVTPRSPGSFVIVSHPGADAPVCPGSGRKVDHKAQAEPVELQVPDLTDGEEGPALPPGWGGMAGDERIEHVKAASSLDLLLAMGAGNTKARVEREITRQREHLEKGLTLLEAARAGDGGALRELAAGNFQRARKSRSGVAKAFDRFATWAQSELDSEAKDLELDAAARQVADKAGPAERLTVSRAIQDLLLPEWETLATTAGIDFWTLPADLSDRVKDLRSGVRGARTAARKETEADVLAFAVVLERHEKGEKARESMIAVLDHRRKALEEAAGAPVVVPERAPRAGSPGKAAARQSGAQELPDVPEAKIPGDLAGLQLWERVPVSTLGGALEIVSDLHLDHVRSAASAEMRRSDGGRERVIDALHDRLQGLEKTAPADVVRDAGEQVQKMAEAADDLPQDGGKPDPRKAALASDFAPGTTFRLVNDRDLYAQSPGQEPRRLGDTSDPHLVGLVDAVRLATAEPTRKPSRLAAALHALAEALPEAKAAGIRIRLEIDTAEGGGAS